MVGNIFLFYLNNQLGKFLTTIYFSKCWQHCMHSQELCSASCIGEVM